jgi:hypothetical protein
MKKKHQAITEHEIKFSKEKNEIIEFIFVAKKMGVKSLDYI